MDELCAPAPCPRDEVHDGRDLQVVAVKSYPSMLSLFAPAHEREGQEAKTTTGAWGSWEQTHTDSESHTEVLVSVMHDSPEL